MRHHSRTASAHTPGVITIGVVLLTLQGMPPLNVSALTAGQYVPHSTHKICQETGETDRELGKPTLNQTETNYGLVGTDLGSSFSWMGANVFLYGDTQPDQGPASSNRAPDLDSLATSPANSTGCVPLKFTTRTDGTYADPIVPGISQGSYEVPVSGFSI